MFKYKVIIIFFVFYTKVFAQIDSLTNQLIYNDALLEAHFGINIYNLSKNETFYSYHGSKRFMPASNQKISTTYLGLKYLPEELEVFEYYINKDSLFIFPSADPTFLYKKFNSEKVLNFLKSSEFKTIVIDTRQWQEEKFSEGWIWDDYNYDFMAEKTIMPIYGNMATFFLDKNKQLVVTPYFLSNLITINKQKKIPIINTTKFSLMRDYDNNNFNIKESSKIKSSISIPLITNNTQLIKLALEKLTKKKVLVYDRLPTVSTLYSLPKSDSTKNLKIKTIPTTSIINTDSINLINYHKKTIPPLSSLTNTNRNTALKYMMDESDNFIAEQLIMMISKKILGVINTKELLNKKHNEDFFEISKMSAAKDGSGLSIYNWISPNQLVLILNKIYKEFEWDNIESVFVGANEGTLKDYFKNYEGNIFAKTGSMSTAFCLSGYFIGKRSNNRYAFSFMSNGLAVPVVTVKREIEAYISKLIDLY